MGIVTLKVLEKLLIRTMLSTKLGLYIIICVLVPCQCYGYIYTEGDYFMCILCATFTLLYINFRDGQLWIVMALSQRGSHVYQW